MILHVNLENCHEFDFGSQFECETESDFEAKVIKEQHAKDLHIDKECDAIKTCS